MSIRATPRNVTPITTSSTSQPPINFKDEFTHSAAALAASHDETVTHILSRLDTLQAKLSTQPDSTTTPAARSQPRASNVSVDQSVHARLSSLENLHENALYQLSSKLDQVEQQLTINKESEHLMTQIASRLQKVEPRLQSHADLSDRVVSLESRLRSHADLHDRIHTLEANARPDPNQERIIQRINTKLDILEEQGRNSRKSTALGGEYDRRASLDAEPRAHLDADMDKHERAVFLQSRIEKLKELRTRYENADAM